MTVQERDLWITALHESGHAVAHLVLRDAVIDELWVNGRAGMCHLRRGPSSAVSVLAGACAEWLARHTDTRPSADYLHVGATEDGDVRLAARYLGSADGAVLLAAWVQAERLVDRYWGKILTIALELHRCHRLSGARVEALWHEMSDAA